MKYKYKKSYLEINCILLVTLFILLINFFKIKNYTYLFSNIILFLTFIILFLRYGFEKKKRRFTYETMFSIFSYTVIYLMITYIVGIKLGFNANIYKFNMINIIKNILPYTVLIILSELLRDEITRKADNSFLAYILITFILIMIDSTIFANTFDITIGDGQIKYIFFIILPSISKNILLLYITKIGGLYPCLIYRIIMDLKMFILPIFPDFGYYFESILSVCYPAFLGFIINSGLQKYKNEQIDSRNIRRSKFFAYSTVITITFAVVCIVVLASGKFRYTVISIGSGSMTGTINKGDVVIYERKSNECVPKLGDVLVFRKENKLVVHRIINIVNLKDETVYYTKGDANEKEDGYPINEEEVVGVVKKRIKFVGIPSVALNELTQQ